MNALPSPPAVPAWDREGSFDEARAQIQEQVVRRATDRGSILWLTAEEAPAVQIERILALGPEPVVGSELVLWTWPSTMLAQLSRSIATAGGTLVFLEPTAGLGVRRATQVTARRWFTRTRGHTYGRDVPAELRSAGFVVTTQVRLRHRFVGDYVRGEARHFAPTT